jgi:hypothetical protein
MKKRNRQIALAVAAVAASVGALWGLRFRHPAPEAAFYYWKTQWTASPALERALVDNGAKKLYVRFFDVRWDRESNEPRPVSPIRFSSPAPKSVEVVPVVYLVNEVFRKIRYENVETLADNVWMKAVGIAKAEGIPLRQLQIDCDWSDETKRRYFHFAELLHRHARKEGIQLSSTLRLHQIKYWERTGVPPVDRGMLMFYNFGRIQADSDHSSIFNEADARHYTSYIASYRLPLDIALPVFSWVVHSRDGKILQLLEKLDPQELTEANGFTRVDPIRFRAKESFFFHGRYFMTGDLLLLEESSPATTNAAADLAIRGAGWRKTYQTVALFDLDERNLTSYAHHEIKTILGKF